MKQQTLNWIVLFLSMIFFFAHFFVSLLDGGVKAFGYEFFKYSFLLSFVTFVLMLIIKLKDNYKA